MPFSFTPSTVAMPSGTTSAPVNPNSLTMLSDLTNIASTEESTRATQLANQKTRATMGSSIQKAQADAQKALVDANQAQLDNLISHSNNAITNLRGLRDKKEINNDEVQKLVSDTILNGGGSADSIKQVMLTYPANGTLSDKKAWVAQQEANAAGHIASLEKRYPAAQNVNYGSYVAPVQAGNPAMTGVAPGTQIGPATATTLAPTVAQGPTGEPIQFGGGGVPRNNTYNGAPTNAVPISTIGQPNAVNVQNAPAPTVPVNVAPKAPTNVPAPTGVTPQAMSQPKSTGGQIPYVQGQPYEVFRVKNADVQKMVTGATKALNVSEPDSIPNQRNTNEKIQKLLENKNINIGPVAEAIAKNTGGVGLDAQQDEIRKYLEQRVRMESARTNQDQTSQKAAFGNFGTNRGALKEILYKDNGNLMGQELYQRGLLNRSPDANRPNLQAANQFNQDYIKLATPKVVHLISVIGDKSIKQLTQSDQNHLAKEFSGLSEKEFSDLLDQRQKLLDLVGK